MHSSTGLAIRAKIVVLCRFFGRVRWRLTLPFPFPGAVYRAARQSGTVRLGKGSREGGWVRAPASRPSRCEEAGRENVPPVRLNGQPLDHDSPAPSARGRRGCDPVGRRAQLVHGGGRPYRSEAWPRNAKPVCVKGPAPANPSFGSDAGFRLAERPPSPLPQRRLPSRPPTQSRRRQKAPAGRESTATEQTGRDRRTPPRKPHHRARHARPLNPINPPPPRQPATHRHTPPPPRQPATHHRHIPPPRSQSPRTFSPSVTNASCSVTGFGSSVSFRPPPVLPWWVPSA